MDLERLFKHLTHRAEHFIDDAGRDYEKRIYDARRSERLHWIRHHVEEKSPDCLEVFTVTERDTAKHRDVTKTYLYDAGEHYVIVLEHQRKGGYYLLTAFYLSEKICGKAVGKKAKEKAANRVLDLKRPKKRRTRSRIKAVESRKLLLFVDERCKYKGYLGKQQAFL